MNSRYALLRSHVDSVAKQCGRNPSEITIVAVSKQQPWERAREAYDAGCRDFGENRVPEALEKQEKAPPDVNWHFIGTLQKNKVKKVVGKFALVHSVDRPELASYISSLSVEAGVATRLLLQANTSGELSKHGLAPEEWMSAFQEIKNLPNVHIEGLMTMAPLTDDETVISETFANLRMLRDEIQQKFDFRMPHLSMGMSQDYPIAIKEGATLLRIGSAIFNPK
jgi:pyridoxal phosphate enzyme (YggS family)